jgi:hypothetical protein
MMLAVKKEVAFLKKRWDAHPGPQKTFVRFYTGCCNVPQGAKVFCFFFSKKKRFLSLDQP